MSPETPLHTDGSGAGLDDRQAPPSAQSSLRPGQLVGSYRVVRTLGRGGMATVYEGVHQHIAQRAALKVLSSELARDPVMNARFLNEARAVNIVRHPGLVQIFELGQLDAALGGGAFIVMEFLDGESLAQRLDRGPLAVGEALRMCRQIASALAAAHEKGIVHRDLKPGNVMIVADPDMAEGERTKLLDFGIAKLDGDAAHKMTQTGTVLGTPAYMSPEQCNGADLVTDRTDVYALGIMLFEMLSGAPPFVAERPLELMGKHLFQAPPPLPELAGMPAGLGMLVGAMLAKEPTQRPSMTQVVAALQELGGGGSQVQAVPTELLRLAQDVGLTRASGGAATVVSGEAVTLARQAPVVPVAAVGQRPALARWLAPLAALVIIGVAAVLWSRTPPMVVERPTPVAPAPSVAAAAPSAAPAVPPASDVAAATPKAAPPVEPEAKTEAKTEAAPSRRSAARSRRRGAIAERASAAPATPAEPAAPAKQPTPLYRGTKATIDTTYPGSQ